MPMETGPNFKTHARYWPRNELVLAQPQVNDNYLGITSRLPMTREQNRNKPHTEHILKQEPVDYYGEALIQLRSRVDSRSAQTVSRTAPGSGCILSALLQGL
jgi:hypothetical protein